MMKISAPYIKCRADVIGTHEFELEHKELTQPVIVRALSKRDAEDALDDAVINDLRLEAIRRKTAKIECPRCCGEGTIDA